MTCVLLGCGSSDRRVLCAPPPGIPDHIFSCGGMSLTDDRVESVCLDMPVSCRVESDGTRVAGCGFFYATDAGRLDANYQGFECTDDGRVVVVPGLLPLADAGP